LNFTESLEAAQIIGFPPVTLVLGNDCNFKAEHVDRLEQY